jgi:DNA polymerase (family 10)
MSVNSELATILQQMAGALEFLGESRFRVNAHVRAARVLEELSEDVAALVESDPAGAEQRLCQLPGIGKGLCAKIMQYVQEGRVGEHEELMERVPPGLFELLEIPGIGPKAAQAMWEQLGIGTLAQLRDRIDSDEFADLPRMGARTIENIKRALAFRESTGRRVAAGRARMIADLLLAAVAGEEGVLRADIAGSLRRGRDTAGDVDLLVACDAAEPVARRFTSHPAVIEVLASGPTKCSVRAAVRGVILQVDLRLVPLESYGAALLYFTGSKDHNVRLRERAIKRKLRLNEYGLFPGVEERPRERGVTPVAARTEEDIYRALDLPFVPPELREDRGELEGFPADLVRFDDIGSELHSHTDASDGRWTLDELAAAAKARGYHTIAVTDHSTSSVIARGLSPEGLREHVEAVRAANRRIDGIELLAGTEVDIRADGTLDYDDDLLATLDIVVASPHAPLRQSPEEATRRLVRAVSHPLVDILGHPTGRIVGKREGLAPDMGEVLEAARRNDVALEINANWHRLDLRDVHVRQAVERGCKVAINTDAHRDEDFDMLAYGVSTARRGWLTRDACVNTWSAEQLRGWLRSRRG